MASRTEDLIREAKATLPPDNFEELCTKTKFDPRYDFEHKQVFNWCFYPVLILCGFIGCVGGPAGCFFGILVGATIGVFLNFCVWLITGHRFWGSDSKGFYTKQKFYLIKYMKARKLIDENGYKLNENWPVSHRDVVESKHVPQKVKQHHVGGEVYDEEEWDLREREKRIRKAELELRVRKLREAGIEI